MDTLRWVLLGIVAGELTALVALFTVNCIRHARTGRAFDWARRRMAVIELPRPVKEADALCREGVRATSLRLRVAVEALDARRTSVAVTAPPGLLYRFTRMRAAQLDRFVAWLVRNGGGRVVATGFGKPR